MLSIAARTVLEDLKIGDSVAVNGVCLTVTSLDDGGFTADVMPETLRRSSLGALGPGGRVDLERAMAAGGRFAVTSSPVTSTAPAVSPPSGRRTMPCGIRWRQRRDCCATLWEKGSITIDGISLTVASVEADRFSVSLIPHTARCTVLGYKHPGDTVNLETDIIGKYVEKLCARRRNRRRGASPWNF